MGIETGISWTDSTWNAIRGCSRVSEGCRFCYAESTAYRFSGEGQPYDGLAVLKNGHASWTGKIEFVEKHLLDPLKWSPILTGISNGEGELKEKKNKDGSVTVTRERPRRIFVNSMSDLFHENVTDLMRDKIFSVMQHAQSRGHIFQILTKRPQGMLDYLSNPSLYSRLTVTVDMVRNMYPKLPITPFSDPARFPLKNIWMGVSIEDSRVKDRIDILRNVPAAVRFLSIEPLIGDVGELNLEGISWAIVGGESGPHARPMMSHWAESVREQCEAAGVAYYFKQNGEYVDAGHEEFGKLPAGEIKYLRSDGHEWPYDSVPTDEHADVNTMKRVGRKRSGDTLYGKVYHAFPGGAA